MATNHNPANTNNERNAYWWEQAAECVNTLATFLRSKQRNLTMPGVNLEHGAPVFGANYSTTFTRAQARNSAVEMLFHRAGRKDSTHIPMSRRELAQCGDRALAGWLVEASVHKGVSKPCVVRAMSGYNGEGARYDAQIAASGNGYTVKGVSGTFHSRKQAVKIAARNHFEAEWKSANEINCQETRNAIKAQVITDGLVSQNGVVIQPPQKKKAAPAPVAKQSIASAVVTADQAKKMASAMGATGADIKTKKAAIAYLESIGITL